MSKRFFFLFFSKWHGLEYARKRKTASLAWWTGTLGVEISYRNFRYIVTSDAFFPADTERKIATYRLSKSYGLDFLLYRILAYLIVSKPIIVYRYIIIMSYVSRFLFIGRIVSYPTRLSFDIRYSSLCGHVPPPTTQISPTVRCVCTIGEKRKTCKRINTARQQKNRQEDKINKILNTPPVPSRPCLLYTSPSPRD